MAGVKTGISGQINNNIVTDGLIFYIDTAYKLSYPRTGTTVTDIVGNNSGTWNGATFINTYNGGFDNDGSSDYWICDDRTTDMEFQYDDAFTLSSWVKIEENSQYGMIVNNRIASYGGISYIGWLLSHNNGQAAFAVGGYQGAYKWRNAYTSTSTFTNQIYNQMVNIVGVNTGVAGEQKIYVNGEDATATAGDDSDPPATIDYSSGNHRININRDGVVTHYLQSETSVVSIYNRALSAGDVLQNYQAQKGRFGL